MKNSSLNNSENKFLAIFDQAISSGMSFAVMYLIADSYSLTVYGVLSLIGNISYSYATIAKSQILYPSLSHLSDLTRVQETNSKTFFIPKLRYSLILIISIVVFWISISVSDSIQMSFQMVLFFIGVFLTDFFRNSLVHQGMRIISAKLNMVSALILIFCLSVEVLFHLNLDLIWLWSILQFVFPTYIVINLRLNNLSFLETTKIEKRKGRYFFLESTFSKLASLLGSLFILLSNPNLAGLLAIAYLFFAAFPSLIVSALQPIANQLVNKANFMKPFDSLVVSIYACHILWTGLIYLLFYTNVSIFPMSFQASLSWALGISLSSMTTAFLNLYQIRMLNELGSALFLRFRFVIAIMTGPVGALIIVKSNFGFFSAYTFLLFILLNPISYQKFISLDLFSNCNRREKDQW